MWKAIAAIFLAGVAGYLLGISAADPLGAALGGIVAAMVGAILGYAKGEDR